MTTEIRAKVRKALVFAMVLDIAIAAAVVFKNLNSSSRTFEAKIFRSIADRAQVNLFEDFRGGLDAWESNQPLTRTWSYDPSGLVSPGQLALFFIPIGVQRDAICRLRLLVQGDTFTLYVRGQLVDSWSDGRLHSGGIGMSCEKDEGARIAWVRVSHHADVTGKLCAVASSLSGIGL